MGDAELCAFIAEALSPVKRILRDILPYLAEARRRFAQPGRRVPVPGRPTWGEWVRENLGISDRHARRLLAGGREPQGGGGDQMQVKLDGRQQAALVKAQLAANDLANALRDGRDWRPALAEYERTTVTTARLETYLGTLEREPDWKGVLTKLVSALETFNGTLPFVVRETMQDAQGLLGRNANGDAVRFGPSYPTIPYPGGKGRLAPILVSFMPPKGRLYLEPFAGRGNVFWAACSSRLGFQKWALNDIRTARFFEAVRTIGGTFEVPARSREEYFHQWKRFRQGDPQAILMEPYLTFAGGGYGRGGFGGKKSASALGYTETIRACHSLMLSTGVEVTSLDWTELDWSSLGTDDFVYFDPPYIGGDVRAYRQGDVSHGDLLRLLKGARFKWLLSGYDHESYIRELGQPFYAEDMQLAVTNPRIAGKGEGRRVECVWRNY
jgi:site-specific DNA-adenine methylase